MKIWLTTALLAAPVPALAACPAVPDPVASLNFESRYVDDDPSRSEINEEAEEKAKEALEVLDGFISDLAQSTDLAVETGDQSGFDCAVAALAVWADSDALSSLGSTTVQLTIGSRLSALALIARQLAPRADVAQMAAVTTWLTRRMNEQMTFWETAPEGAASGNLRAWSALAGAAVASLTNDPVMRGWAVWSLSYVACTANADGSLPQEMSRKKRALHYQLHAVAPLTVGAALLAKQGVFLGDRCDNALDRIVAFTLDDLAAGGVKSALISGEAQTLNEGLEGLKDFQLAWTEAWLSIREDPVVEATISDRRPLKYSKLGGNQSQIWGN